MVYRVWRLPNGRSQIQILLSLLPGTLYRRDFPRGLVVKEEINSLESCGLVLGKLSI